jgi:hypothetical protein
MIKNFLCAVALLSLAFAGGCAKGGNGIVPPPVTVDVEPPTGVNSALIYPTQTVVFTATVSNSPTTAVSWTLSGSGTLTTTTSSTATYVAPATAGQTATITATLVSDTSVQGSAPISVVDITTDVAPITPNVGSGLTQQFTAVAIPDTAPQTFTWTCTAAGVPCANFSQDPNISGLAYYKSEDNCSGNCVQISAITPLDTAGCQANPKFCTIAKATPVTSRVSGTYAFNFSGYDTAGKSVLIAGTFTAGTTGSITSGVEDELTSTGWAQHAITGGSYTPTSADPHNSNNAGTLSLTLNSGGFPNKYQVVMDGAGDLEMIESDGKGSGSGIAQISGGSSTFKGDQTFAFGFTGVDSAGARVGYVGVFPMDGSNGSGTISGGQIDVNDNGNSKNAICGAPPCTVTGSYSSNGNGSYQLNLTAPVAMSFNFYIGPGSTSKTTPLTLYAVSTDPGSNPAVVGTMVLQDSTQTYNIAAFKGISVSALTGVNGSNTNVSLTLGTTDGNGNFTGQFDQNNAGTILTVPTSATADAFAYTYAASGTNGRYTFNMLGNPDSSPVVPALPFVLYASGANRGFLLDQSSASVMTGTMSPQGKGAGTLGGSTFPGTYGAATTSSGTSAVTPIAANLLLTYQGTGVMDVGGTQYPGGAVAGTYALSGVAGAGTGTVTLTAPAATYAIYVVDTAGCSNSSPACSVQDFFMIDEDKTNTTPSVIFAKQ